MPWRSLPYCLTLLHAYHVQSHLHGDPIPMLRRTQHNGVVAMPAPAPFTFCALSRALLAARSNGPSGPRCRTRPPHASAWRTRSPSRRCPKTCLTTSPTKCASAPKPCSQLHTHTATLSSRCWQILRVARAAVRHAVDRALRRQRPLLRPPAAHAHSLGQHGDRSTVGRGVQAWWRAAAQHTAHDRVGAQRRGGHGVRLGLPAGYGRAVHPHPTRARHPTKCERRRLVGLGRGGRN